MRIHKGTNWTTFSATCGTDVLTLLLRRVFHPTRGEEAQIDVTIEKNTTRKYTMKAVATMTPDEARDFCTVLLGRYAPPVTAVAPGSDMLNRVVNQYQPVEYPGKLTEREARIAKAAFLDGYNYCHGQGAAAPKTAP